MKLLHTVPSIDLANGGGLGAAALALHQQLLVDNHQSHLVASSREERSDLHHFTRLPIAWPNPFFYDYRNRALLNAAVREADVVHVHGLYNHLNWCVGDACARWQKPLVYHPHGTLASWYQRKRWLAKKVVHQLFEDRNFRLVRLWRAVSEEERRDIEAAFPGARVAVIPNGIHSELFSPSSAGEKLDSFPGLDPARRCLLFMGRIAAVKGIDFLVEAWARLGQFHRDWQLVLAGPDFENYKRRLVAQLAHLDQAAAPLLLESVTGAAKLQLLRSADLFVLPSRAEGQPIAALEALASSLPVVVSRECNLSSAMLGEAGWVCQSNTDSLRQTLTVALAQNPVELQRRGAAGRAIIESQFDWRETSAAIVDWSQRTLEAARN